MPADAPAHAIGVDLPDSALPRGLNRWPRRSCQPRGVQLLEWADRHLEAADLGPGGYGAGLAGHLNDAGERVVEFGHPRSAATRDGAKTDALDARRAAREVLGQREPCIPRARGRREALRVLDTTRRGAQRARVAAICELKALLVTAPVDLRDQLRGLTTAALGQVQRPQTSTVPRRGARRHQTGPEVDRPRIKTLTRDRPTRSGDPPAAPPPPSCSTSPASAPSPPPRSNRLVPPRAMPQRSASAGSRASKPPPGRQHATASTAAATATSTGHCTPSPSPAADTAPNPGLHRQKNQRGQNHTRSPALPQTLHRPPALPTPTAPTNHHLTNIEGLLRR